MLGGFIRGGGWGVHYRGRGHDGFQSWRIKWKREWNLAWKLVIEVWGFISGPDLEFWVEGLGFGVPGGSEFF